jgi:2'-hydroxyisoflavone reductase
VKVLVIGGSRFMGVATVERLLAAGHEVTVFNRGTRAGLWAGRAREVYGDRSDAAALAQLARDAFDGVVDFCAYTARDTDALLDVVGDVARLVHLSSGTVYRLDPVLPWPEETPYGPAALWGDYARGKIECEQTLRARRDPALATTAVRLPWVLGPGNYADRERFVLNRLLDGEVVLLPGDGKSLHQFVSSAQVADAIVRILERSRVGWSALNIASPGYVSLEAFVRICGDVAGVDVRVRCVGGGATGTGEDVFRMAEPVFPFPNENYLLDLSASAAAGVAPPPTTLRQMLEDALSDLEAHPDRRAWRRTTAELAQLAA